MSQHDNTEYVGTDRYGIEYVKCECGVKYPADAGDCPHSPSDMTVNTGKNE